jgi:periplasmic protein TonB
MRTLVPFIAAGLVIGCAQAPERTPAPAAAVAVPRPAVEEPRAAAPVNSPPFAPTLVAPIRVEYPIEARRQQQEGSVRIGLRVLKDGSVGKVEIVQSSGFATLDQAAMKAVAAAKFVPARTADGTLAEARVIVPVMFRLEP